MPRHATVLYCCTCAVCCLAVAMPRCAAAVHAVMPCYCVCCAVLCCAVLWCARVLQCSHMHVQQHFIETLQPTLNLKRACRTHEQLIAQVRASRSQQHSSTAAQRAAQQHSSTTAQRHAAASCCICMLCCNAAALQLHAAHTYVLSVLLYIAACACNDACCCTYVYAYIQA